MVRLNVEGGYVSAVRARNGKMRLLPALLEEGASPAKKAGAAPATGARTSTKGYKLGKVAPKYRNPLNTAETWAGRGQQPKWMATQIAGGRKLEDFLIK